MHPLVIIRIFSIFPCVRLKISYEPSGIEEVKKKNRKRLQQPPVDETYTVSSLSDGFEIPLPFSFAFLRSSSPVQALALPLFTGDRPPLPHLILFHTLPRTHRAASTAFFVNTRQRPMREPLSSSKGQKSRKAFFSYPHLITAETRKPVTLYSFSLRIFIAPSQYCTL